MIPEASIDEGTGMVYVKLEDGPVDRTITLGSTGGVEIVMDLDAEGNCIGVEVIP